MLKEEAMEEPRSVNSPRRILSLSKRQRASISFPYPEDKASSSSSSSSPGFGISGDHGPKPAEVYGFVGLISTVVAASVFMVWAYFPENWLHSMGIYYYPSRYWAVVVPTYAMVTIVLAIAFYIGLNFMATPPPTSFNTIFDEFSRDPVSVVPLTEEEEQPIEPISDIGIDKINEAMFNSWEK